MCGACLLLENACLLLSPGARNPDAVRRVLHTSTALSLSITTALAFALWTFRHATARIFTKDPIVINTVVACMPGLLLSLIGDSINTVLSGAVRGSGRQVLGFFVNLCTYWLVGLPAGVLVALHWGFGAPGLWAVMVGVSALQALLLAVFVWRIDWGGEVVRAQHLVRSQSSRLSKRQPESGSRRSSSSSIGGGTLDAVKDVAQPVGEPTGS